MSDKITAYWNKFLLKNGLDEKTNYMECFHFDLSEEVANELLQLVLDGKKSATASSLWYFEKSNLPLPEIGGYSIITDWAGNPKCVIQTTAIQILLFKEMTYDICKREGEDDSLESWQKNHIKFFSREGDELGYQFNQDMPIVFEDFKVVYK